MLSFCHSPLQGGIFCGPALSPSSGWCLPPCPPRSCPPTATPQTVRQPLTFLSPNGDYWLPLQRATGRLTKSGRRISSETQKAGSSSDGRGCRSHHVSHSLWRWGGIVGMGERPRSVLSLVVPRPTCRVFPVHGKALATVLAQLYLSAPPLGV